MKDELLILDASSSLFKELESQYLCTVVSSLKGLNEQLSKKTYALIVLVASPRSDRIKTAMELAARLNQNILLLCEASVLDVAQYQVSQLPVFVLEKKTDFYILDQVIRFLIRCSREMKDLQDKIDRQSKQLQEEKQITQAKLLLIEKMNYSEEAAHRYITKKAMDLSMTKVNVARLLIKRLQEKR